MPLPFLAALLPMLAKGGALAGKAALAGGKAGGHMLKAGIQNMSPLAGSGEESTVLKGGVSNGGFLSNLFKNRLEDGSRILLENALGRNPNNKHFNITGLPGAGMSPIMPPAIAGLGAPQVRPMAPTSQFDPYRRFQ